MAPLEKPASKVNEILPHMEDFHLAERCLLVDTQAILHLQRHYGPLVMAFLMKAGADVAQAEEIVQTLWADLIVAPPGSTPRLSRYNGSCQLLTWLNTVSMNRLQSARRSQRRVEKYVETSLEAPHGEGEDGRTVGSSLPAPEKQDVELPLISLLRNAIDAAMAACSAEDFVLLHLAHLSGLRQRELGQIWGCNPGTISRRLDQITTGIAQRVIAHVRAADPLLDLTWEDFLDLCRTTSLGALSAEE